MWPFGGGAMRITTIDELESYLLSEASRIQAGLAALAEIDGDDAPSSVRSVFLDGRARGPFKRPLS